MQRLRLPLLCLSWQAMLLLLTITANRLRVLHQVLKLGFRELHMWPLPKPVMQCGPGGATRRL